MTEAKPAAECIVPGLADPLACWLARDCRYFSPILGRCNRLEREQAEQEAAGSRRGDDREHG